MADIPETLLEKIDRLNRQAFDMRVNDSNGARVLSEEILVLANKANYIKGLAEGLRTMGFCELRLSKNEEAMGYLKESLKLFQLLNDPFGQGNVLSYFGIIQRNLGDYRASLESFQKGWELIKQGDYPAGLESTIQYHLGATYKYMGNLEKALECFLTSLSIAKEEKKHLQFGSANVTGESYSLNNIGGLYFEFGDYHNALKYFHESHDLRRTTGDKWGEAGSLDNIGYTQFKLGEVDEAIEFCNLSLTTSQSVGDKKGQGNALFHLAEIHHSIKQFQQAKAYADQSLGIRKENNDKKGQAEVYLCLAEILRGHSDGTNSEDQLEYLNKAVPLGQETKALDLLYKIHQAFYSLHKERGQYPEALSHLESFHSIEKEIHSNTINQKIQSLEINNQMELSKKETEIFRLKNIELAALNEETNFQKEEIERTLLQLKETQSQLIQSEKMASLGELTAGIAHEIQNPLNFVNNFSEINTELIEEMKLAFKAGKSEDVIALANDVAENEKKINHHGKRAGDIVKGMLQHSRASTGVKEPTDINALAEEYLRLAYHGLRAKDKSFIATTATEFDPSVGSVPVIPQDIGRVILNLITNAFYAITERSKQQPNGFTPTVVVSTTKKDGKVLITVKDNGLGIPATIKDKIFQPFFTTKPTGQGTGLGLSLSYDIVKAHGGELKVETKEGEGSEFSVILPLG